jgi:phosphinothricin acetyltransferase
MSGAAPRIEPAAERHLPAIAAIYAHAADTSAVTFELKGPPESRWRKELAASDPGAGRMVLVALDDHGEVLGYTKSGTHRLSGAYAVTCETSIYVAEGGGGRGVGGVLYDALLARLDESPLRLAVAGVAEPNEASTRLHLSRGFTPVGTFSRIGAKRGRAWDVTWYQRPLATPALVQEVQAAGSLEDAEAAIARHYPGGRVGDLDGGIPILDPADAERLAAIAVPTALGAADRLLLEWCAEALAPLSIGLSGESADDHPAETPL